jgi:DNA-directed RNA polymerase subunit M/transcription elongation factor TFIIS
MDCPECGSIQIVKSGVQILNNGEEKQRLKCSDCGRKFSENYIRFVEQKKKRQLCAVLKEAKKLDSVTETKTVTGNVKGKVLEYYFKMKRDGYAESTIRLTNTALRVLIKRGRRLNRS